MALSVDSSSGESIGSIFLSIPPPPWRYQLLSCYKHRSPHGELWIAAVQRAFGPATDHRYASMRARRTKMQDDCIRR